MGGGLVTVVAVSALGGRLGIGGLSLSDSFAETDDSKSSSKFLASVISPRAMLGSKKLKIVVKHEWPEDSLQAWYDIRPHFEKLFRSHGLRRRIRGFRAALFVLVIEPVGTPDINPPTRGISLLKKVVTSLSKQSTDVFCELVVGIWGPGEWCERAVGVK